MPSVTVFQSRSFFDVFFFYEAKKLKAQKSPHLKQDQGDSVQADVEEIEAPIHNYTRDSLDLTRSHFFEQQEAESLKPPSAQMTLEETINNDSLLDFEENRVRNPHKNH